MHIVIQYTKDNFIKFLKEIGINNENISKFNSLPKKIKKSGLTYDLFIQTIKYEKDDHYYEFELNYYSDNHIEYLFTNKVFKDVNLSINNLYLNVEKLNETIS